jgi:hypothetical protein
MLKSKICSNFEKNQKNVSNSKNVQILKIFKFQKKLNLKIPDFKNRFYKESAFKKRKKKNRTKKKRNSKKLTGNVEPAQQPA